jgi:hypothetical protein
MGWMKRKKKNLIQNLSVQIEMIRRVMSNKMTDNSKKLTPYEPVAAPIGNSLPAA